MTEVQSKNQRSLMKFRDSKWVRTPVGYFLTVIAAFELGCAVPLYLMFMYNLSRDGVLTPYKAVHLALIGGGLFFLAGLFFWAFIGNPIRKMSLERERPK